MKTHPEKVNTSFVPIGQLVGPAFYRDWPHYSFLFLTRADMRREKLAVKPVLHLC